MTRGWIAAHRVVIHGDAKTPVSYLGLEDAGDVTSTSARTVLRVDDAQLSVAGGAVTMPSAVTGIPAAIPAATTPVTASPAAEL